MNITASYLFAPGAHNPGPHRCYYCGLACDEQYTVAEYVKGTFTNRDVVRYPGSYYVCGCCMESLKNYGDITLADGERRTGRKAAIRMYSWVLADGKQVAFTKRHLDYARGIILDPPKPPFSIVLANSGQKQLIFRAPVAMSRDYYPLMLEEEIITVNPPVLAKRIELAQRVAAAIGKPGLLEQPSVNLSIACEKYYGNIGYLVMWWEVRTQPTSRLAAWLCPAKDACRESFPALQVE